MGLWTSAKSPLSSRANWGWSGRVNVAGGVEGLRHSINAASEKSEVRFAEERLRFKKAVDAVTRKRKHPERSVEVFASDEHRLAEALRASLGAIGERPIAPGIIVSTLRHRFVCRERQTSVCA